MSKDNGGPAFPWKRDRHPQESLNSITSGSGMTLLDFFAAHIMCGMNASPELMQIMTSESLGDGTHFERMARAAYRLADAMIKERNA